MLSGHSTSTIIGVKVNSLTSVFLQSVEQVFRTNTIHPLDSKYESNKTEVSDTYVRRREEEGKERA